MTHVLNQLTPLVMSYPLWLFVSAMLWLSGQMSERLGALKMYGAFAICIAAGIYVWQGH